MVEIKAFVKSNFRDNARWAVKDPRICRFLPMWRRALAELGLSACVLLMLRHPWEVSASIEKRNKWGVPLGELLWLRYIFDALAGSEGWPTVVVRYVDLLEDPVAAVNAALGHLDLNFSANADDTAISAFVERSWNHHEAPPCMHSDDPISLLSRRTYSVLDAAAGGTPDWMMIAALRGEFEEIWSSQFSRLEQVFQRLAETRDNHSAAMKEITRLSSEVESYVDLVEQARWQLREQLEAHHGERARLLTEMDAARSRQERLAAELNDSRAKEIEMISQMQEAAKQRRKLMEQNSELRQQYQSLLEKTDALGQAVEHSRQGHESLNIHLAETIKRLDLAERANQNVSQKVSEQEAFRNTEGEKLRLILDGLQNQINILGGRATQLESRVFHRGILNWVTRSARGAFQRGKRGAKDFAKWMVVALPGSAEAKSQRLNRALNAYHAVVSGVNGQAMLSDVRALSQQRWPAQPAYHIRLEHDDVADLDISVVLYESERWLEEFCESILKLEYPLKRVRLWLRDHSIGNATERAFDRLRERLSTNLAEVHYSRGHNVGFGAGHNHNFRRSAAEYFLVCNVDGRFRRDSLRVLVMAALSSNAKVAAWEMRQAPFEHPKYYDPVTMMTTWASGACTLYRRACYAGINGFDDAIFMYGEDVDLSYRLRAKGWNIAYVPAAIFDHATYEGEETFKPLQFHGSTLANILLRLRFGAMRDIAAIPGMWLELARQAQRMRLRRAYARNSLKLMWRAPAFFLSRFRVGRIAVPFARWDYGLRRDGAFERVEVVPDEVPLVSVIVRTYRGRGELLRQALASIANQTYVNVEAVVVEDKGNTLRQVAADCAREFGLSVSYQACLDADSNRCRTGNIGMERADGRYFCFLDDDDLLFADHVEYLVSRHAAQPLVSACYALAWEVKIVQAAAEGLQYMEVMHDCPSGMKRSFDRGLLRKMNYIPIQAVLFKRELFERYGGFNERLENLEDWELWRRYSNAHEFLYCPKTTSLYHVPFDSGKQATRQAKLDEYYPIADAMANEFMAQQGDLPESTNT
jgi:GT2 family glycosyltransferase